MQEQSMRVFGLVVVDVLEKLGGERDVESGK
jgi:hypothetical protein